MSLREWATPITIGSFALMAVTGVLMFFHLDTGLNKPAHEWLGWAMVLGVVLHSAANFGSFKRYFSQRSAQAVIGVFLLTLGLSFLPLGNKGGGGKPAPVKAAEALIDAPIPVLAQVTGKDAQTLVAQLGQAGITVSADGTLRQAVSGRKEQMQALGLILDKGTAPKPQ